MRRFASVISVLVMAYPGTVFAQRCPCGPLPSVADAQRGALAVFEGRVLQVSFLKSEPATVQAQLEVVRAWKGMDAERATVLSPPADVTHEAQAACTYAFEPGESYLVYALGRGPNNALEVSACGRTRPIEEADQDVAQLGMGSAPVVAQSAPATAPDATATTGVNHEPRLHGGCASCSVLGKRDTRTPLGLPALLLLGSTAWRVRRRRARRPLSP
jgi:hypothetical protein